MFHKSFKIKANTQLKGSDRKKILCEVMNNFPKLTEDELLKLIPKKETMCSMKLVTHSGDFVIVYSVQNIPIVFVFENVYYPTVYMLWTFPNLLPVFTTWPQVLQNINSGADLMLPGVIVKEGMNIHAYGNLEKGARVAINLASNKAPVAVGVTALSSSDMRLAARRGKAVKIYHITGDHLCALGTILTIPELGPTEGVGNVQIKAESVQQVTEKATTNYSRQTEVAESGACGCTSAIDNTEEVMVEAILQDVNVDEERNGTSYYMSHTIAKLEMSTEDLKKEMDELLLNTFLKTWKTMAKNVEFPILTSNFYRIHMLPECPEGKSVDLKKSSYKKLSKFLRAMQDAGFITLRELTKGVECIISVDYGHSKLKEYVDQESTRETANILITDDKPEIIEKRIVTTAMLPIFSNYGYRKGESLSVADIRKNIRDYVKIKELHNSSDKSIINLDSTLKEILHCPNASSIKWEDLMHKFIDQMPYSYQISFPGQGTFTGKGKLDSIVICVEKRGIKKVTLVNNLEVYKISVQEFAKQCQHGVATSTSISTIAGKKRQQLLIQGDQVHFVVNLLTSKYKIPKQYIKV